MECKIKNISFRKEGDTVVMEHKLAHTKISVPMELKEVEILYKFLTSVHSDKSNDVDMRIPGVGC